MKHHHQIDWPLLHLLDQRWSVELNETRLTCFRAQLEVLPVVHLQIQDFSKSLKYPPSTVAVELTICYSVYLKSNAAMDPLSESTHLQGLVPFQYAHLGYMSFSCRDQSKNMFHRQPFRPS